MTIVDERLPHRHTGTAQVFHCLPRWHRMQNRNRYIVYPISMKCQSYNVSTEIQPSQKLFSLILDKNIELDRARHSVLLISKGRLQFQTSVRPEEYLVALCSGELQNQSNFGKFGV